VSEALSEIAVSVNSSLELGELLNDVARRSRRVLGCDRASILLAGPDGRLIPAASSAHHRNPSLYLRFREMEPLGTDSVPVIDTLFEVGEVLVIEDVATSPFLSERLKAEFGLCSLAVAPLVVQGDRCGALVIDYSTDVHRFAEDEIRTLEALAALTATAVRNARAYGSAVRHGQNLDRMLAVAAALNGAGTLDEVLRCAMDGMLKILGGQSCSIHLIDGDWITTLSSLGPGQPQRGVHLFNGVDSRERERIREMWASNPRLPLVYEGATRATLIAECPELTAAGSLVLLPFAHDGRTHGFVLVGVADPALINAEDFNVATSIAGQVWLAVERARLSEDVARRLHHLEILNELSDALAVTPDMSLVLDRLAPAVRSATPAELIDVVLADRRAARLFEAPVAHGQAAALVRAWRRDRQVRPVAVGGHVVVPMRLDEELVGLLRVRPLSPLGLAQADEDLLLAIAAGVAGLVSRAVLRVDIASGERALAISDERERIARDLHDSLGQTLFAIGLEVGDCAESVEDVAVQARLGRVQGTLSQANAEVRQAIHALSFLDRSGHGLVRSLRDLVKEVAATGAFHVEVKVKGSPFVVSPAKEEALFRVAYEALSNIERHARASAVIVQLSYSDDAVQLVVRDDGVGMVHRPGGEGGLHFGLRTMRRRMQEVGGTFEIHSAAPHGVRLVASVPMT
jgi:signal transduction histidine kinase